MARLFKKNGKLFRNLYIIASLVVLLLALVFNTQYIYVPSSLEDVATNLKLTNDMIFFSSIIAFAFLPINLILGNYNRRHFYKTQLVTGIVILAIPTLFAVVTFVLLLVFLPTFISSMPEIIAYAGTSYLKMPFPVNSFTIILSVFILIIYIGVLALNIIYFIKRYQIEQLEVKVVENNGE